MFQALQYRLSFLHVQQPHYRISEASENVMYQIKQKLVDKAYTHI